MAEGFIRPEHWALLLRREATVAGVPIAASPPRSGRRCPKWIDRDDVVP